jgi:hypothetical protein
MVVPVVFNNGEASLLRAFPWNGESVLQTLIEDTLVFLVIEKEYCLTTALLSLFPAVTLTA